MLEHIIDRFIIHLFSGASVALIALWGFWIIERKVKWWPEMRGWMFYIFPTLLAFVFISFREIWDVHNGGLLVKSVTDWISWILGLGAANYCLYRLTPKLDQVLKQIKKRRAERR